ncbi:MAG: 30S ribosomal protein S4 [Chloroflexi bacterium]|nr:30S ribosomal protein S4 [Chloroflexota bacterium]
MARYTGPKCKLCRREGMKLYLKGTRCLSPKCAIENRNYPPGEHGRERQFGRSRQSDFSLQLREKQKVRRIYGILERQFRRYYKQALQQPGLTGSNLLIALENRLDNIVYRSGYADSRDQARQLVSHGHFEVNGRRTDVPSYSLRPGDEIRVRDGSRRRTYFKEVRDRALEYNPPDWLERDVEQLTAKVIRQPERAEIELPPVNEQLIVEYYSR